MHSIHPSHRMNKKTLFSILKYLISLTIAGGLFWLIYRGQDMKEMLKDLKDAKLSWIALSILTAIFSHWSRATRWVIALRPLGYQTRKTTAFLAVMVGYFANFFVPRLGEVMRCGIFKKTEDVPVNVSFGAVIAERALDLIILLLLSTITLLIEFDKIGEFVISQFANSSDTMAEKLTILAILGAAGLLGLVFLYFIRKWLFKQALFIKIREFAIGMKDGLLSIRKLNKVNQLYFLLHTINIWVMYYFMSYLLFFSLEETENLSAMCGLSVLIMGGIGMALPSPGGIGTYHLFVSTTLIAYGLTESIGRNFAFLMHSSQTISIIIIGGISFIISLLIGKNKAKKLEEEKIQETTI